MKTDTRHIVVKTMLNADEFLAFERQCQDADISHSRAIRDLVKHWMHRSSSGLRRERPRAGHNLAMFPGRRGGAPMPLRL